MMNNRTFDGDEYTISKYISPTNEEEEKEIDLFDARIDQAAEYMQQSGNIIILPTTKIHDLEDQWIKFNSQIKHDRRQSDWKSIEIFGKNNREHYDELRSKILQGDLHKDINYTDNMEEKNTQFRDMPLVEGFIDDYFDSMSVNYTEEDIADAVEWAEESFRTIIIPTRTEQELDSLYDDYNMMIKKHRRESDWKSIELFGMNNEKHYQYLKAQFQRRDLTDREKEKYLSIPIIESTTQSWKKKYFRSVLKEAPMEAVKAILEMSMPNNNINEEILVSNVISDVIDNYDGITQSVPSIEPPYGDMPIVTPEDMIDSGVYGQAPADNYFGAIADNAMLNDEVSVEEWFEEYKRICDGSSEKFNELSSDWVHKVRELELGLKTLKESGTQEEINSRKQSLLELGWNPDIEFSDKARSFARKLAQEHAIARANNIDIIDLCEFVDKIDDASEATVSINEDGAIKQKLYPIYLMLTEGVSIVSAAIKGVTHDQFSHASIAFDSSLKKVFSFNMNNNVNRGGGLIIEDVKKAPANAKIGLYVFFVPLHIWEKMKIFVDGFVANLDKTSYGFENLISILGGVSVNRDWRLVCSEFVDKCLKCAGIDIVNNKHSSLVSPADLHHGAESNNAIYKVYYGLCSKYNESKVKKVVDSLIGKVKPIKEQTTYTDERSYILALTNNIYNIPALLEMKNDIHLIKRDNVRNFVEKTIYRTIEPRAFSEAKEFPIQFDRDGNLLIKNLKKLDYDEEYNKSHKLLKEYEAANNLEGIKYELSKLWTIYLMIEKAINNGKEDSKIKELYDSKARILNDFKHYLKIVLEVDKTFNFTDYYEKSPFSSAVVKINSSTLTHVGRMITTFIKSL